jgi:hypothetical protein
MMGAPARVVPPRLPGRGLDVWGRMPDMGYATFDDPVLVAAMTAFVDATAAVESAADDVEIVDFSETRALAGLVLRKRLLELGWSAPVSQRSTT